MKKYEAVILGSGHFAVGYASACENALIVERTYLADAVHGATLSGYAHRGIESACEQTEELVALYKKHGILKGERIDSPLLEIGLSAYAKSKGIRFLFGTECTQILKTEDEYEIELFGNAGFETVFAKRLVDNRSSDADTVRILIRSEQNAARSVALNCADVLITDAFHEGEAVMSCKFKDGIRNVNAAKAELLCELEEKLPDGVGAVQVAYLAASGDGDAIRSFNDGVILAKEAAK